MESIDAGRKPATYSENDHMNEKYQGKLQRWIFNPRRETLLRVTGLYIIAVAILDSIIAGVSIQETTRIAA